MEYKRITLLCGHYGSGKTNVAVNVAFDLKNKYDTVAIADLDIVNPYFRSKDSSEDFEDKEIRLICSEYANTNVDIPALPPDMYALTDDKRIRAVIDVGGDDRGALALGRIAPKILEEKDYEMLMVINCYRPLTRDLESTLEVMQEIEQACKIPFTGLVNNSNLGKDTCEEDVLKSVEYAEQVSKATGLPIKMTAVEQGLYDKLKSRIENLFPLILQKKLI